jgi:catechol 2,3-dioxygenase-like lactoylglutathione lyase family enzyme
VTTTVEEDVIDAWAVTLGYAIFFAADLERSIRFYRDSLGIPLRFATDSYAEFQTDGAKFPLYSRAHLPELIGREAARTGALAPGRDCVPRGGPRRRV